jgi:NAD+ kinase
MRELIKPPAGSVPPGTVGIVAKTSSPSAVELAKKAAAYLKEQGVTPIGDFRTAQACGGALEQAGDEAFGARADLIIVLGGDGTFIRAVSMVREKRAPVLGINVGWLGFLTDVKRDEMQNALADLVAGRYECEQRMRLRVSVVHNGSSVWEQDVLNEVVVVKNALSPTIHVDASADGTFVSRFRGDGLMVATPTGSTGYNMAAHGPIIYPTLRCIVLTPISPHMLAYRPIVLPEGVNVSIRLSKSRGRTFANLDGLRGLSLETGDEIRVQESPNPVLVVVPGSRDYFNILRTKLRWGEE